MEKAKKDLTQELGEGKILPLVFRLTIPAVVAQLITFLYNIVDRMYVAKIEGTGMDALAALGVVLPITLIMQAFANLVGLGNILMSLFPPFIGMLLLWTINAYAQSMLWSSVLGSVTAVYDEQAAKRKMSVMITSVAVGNILGIIVNTLFIECYGIRYAFIVPGALTFVMGILTYAAVREIGGAAAAHGVMKENIGLWMAVYVADVYAADLTKSSYYILLIPAIGLLRCGIYPTLFRLCGKDENKVSLAAFAVCAAAAVFLCAGSIGIFFSVLALGIIHAAVSVINTSVLSIYPLRYSDTGNTASVSGTTDFSTYFGAGVSSAVYSAVIKHFVYLPMFVSWAVISVLSIFILIVINKNSAARA